MKKPISILLILFILATFSFSQTVSFQDNPELAGKIELFEKWIQAQMEYRGIVGLSIGIVYDQNLIWTKGFGYADQEKKIPATPETIYRIASISKTFTSTAILQLRDSGKLRLDDPINKYLPWSYLFPSFTDSKGLTPAANLSSCVVDLAKYISFQINGFTPVLKANTLREMHRVYWLQPHWKSGWELGWGIRKEGERTIVSHGGCVGGYRTQVSFCSTDKIGIVVLTNSDDIKGKDAKIERIKVGENYSVRVRE
ncbi:MAG: serine hydrolase domain-containing protein [Candidatus Neomarinimicrobiota bacterium]